MPLLHIIIIIIIIVIIIIMQLSAKGTLKQSKSPVSKFASISAMAAWSYRRTMSCASFCQGEAPERDTAPKERHLCVAAQCFERPVPTCSTTTAPLVHTLPLVPGQREGHILHRIAVTVRGRRGPDLRPKRRARRGAGSERRRRWRRHRRRGRGSAWGLVGLFGGRPGLGIPAALQRGAEAHSRHQWPNVAHARLMDAGRAERKFE